MGSSEKKIAQQKTLSFIWIAVICPSAKLFVGEDQSRPLNERLICALLFAYNKIIFDEAQVDSVEEQIRLNLTMSVTPRRRCRVRLCDVYLTI